MVPFSGTNDSYALEFLSWAELKRGWLGESQDVQQKGFWRLQRPLVQTSQCMETANSPHLHCICSWVTALSRAGHVQQRSGPSPAGHIRRLCSTCGPSPHFLETLSPQKVHLDYSILLGQYELLKKLMEIQCKSWSVGLGDVALCQGKGEVQWPWVRPWLVWLGCPCFGEGSCPVQDFGLGGRKVCSWWGNWGKGEGADEERASVNEDGVDIGLWFNKYLR